MFRPFGVPVPAGVKKQIKQVVRKARERNTKPMFVLMNKYYADKTSDREMLIYFRAEEESKIEMAVI